MRNILFLCTGNSARSIMAEAYMNHAGAPSWRAFSAGSTPTGMVNPFALETLKAHGVAAPENARSKSWDEFAVDGAPMMDVVVTVCDNAANETCPVWPGQPVSAHWGVPDPSETKGSDAEIAAAFADTYRMLRQRISIFTSLPMGALDKMALQRELDRIGKGEAFGA